MDVQAAYCDEVSNFSNAVGMHEMGSPIHQYSSF